MATNPYLTDALECIKILRAHHQLTQQIRHDHAADQLRLQELDTRMILAKRRLLESIPMQLALLYLPPNYTYTPNIDSIIDLWVKRFSGTYNGSETNPNTPGPWLLKIFDQPEEAIPDCPTEQSIKLFVLHQYRSLRKRRFLRKKKFWMRVLGSQYYHGEKPLALEILYRGFHMRTNTIRFLTHPIYVTKKRKHQSGSTATTSKDRLSYLRSRPSSRPTFNLCSKRNTSTPSSTTLHSNRTLLLVLLSKVNVAKTMKPPRWPIHWQWQA